MKQTLSKILSCLRKIVNSFFSLFGYKREGKFAKCVWRTFAASSAAIMFILAGAAIYDVYRQISIQQYYDRSMALYGERISPNIYFSENDGDGVVINTDTGKKLLKHVAWVAKPLGNDSLVCYSDGKLRGYFRKSDGKVVIPPKYKHAWVFSDGMAAVEEDGIIKFIDSTGKVVLDKGMTWNPNFDSYVFHGGYIVVPSDNKERYGLMDRSGKLVLPIEYDDIHVSSNLKFWIVRKDEQSAVYNEHLDLVLPYADGYTYFTDEGFNLVRPNHSVCCYDYSGKIINDFCINSVRNLEYDTDEILYKGEVYTDDDGDETAYFSEEHKKATARLRAYVAGDYYEGLMTAEGKIITMPLYKDIKAISPDTYLCELSEDYNIVVNGKGEVVR